MLLCWPIEAIVSHLACVWFEHFVQFGKSQGLFNYGLKDVRIASMNRPLTGYSLSHACLVANAIIQCTT